MSVNNNVGHNALKVLQAPIPNKGDVHYIQDFNGRDTGGQKVGTGSAFRTQNDNGSVDITLGGFMHATVAADGTVVRAQSHETQGAISPEIGAHALKTMLILHGKIKPDETTPAQ
jgi:hypothetical protein